MAAPDIAVALQRVEAVLKRRPGTGLHDDSSATSRWEGGTRVISSHANGKQFATDMPLDVGGRGDEVTPGWLLRAGVASCTATCIAMAAATEGIELTSLEVQADSRSDMRGMLGMTDTDGGPVCAGPQNMLIAVRICARGIAAERLQALVERSYCRSPMVCAVRDAVPLELRIEIAAA
jgi:uncharacterized OsmC-like protein